MEQLDIKSLYEEELKEKMIFLEKNRSRGNSCISGLIKAAWL